MTDTTESLIAELDRYRHVAPALSQLRDHQTQLDMDGVMVGVSRQAIDEVLTAFASLAADAAAMRATIATTRRELERIAKPHNHDGNIFYVVGPFDHPNCDACRSYEIAAQVLAQTKEPTNG